MPNKPWQWALIIFFGLFAAGVTFSALVALVVTPTLPSVAGLTETRLKVPLRVYTADGQLIAEFGEEKRIPVKVSEVPDELVKAILAAEDHSFYQHHGVDLLGIVRAAWHNFRTKSPGQGASTITMQVARNFFLSPEKTYTRKLKEILLALKIERELTKQEILELYMNKIFLGHRAYGFAAAAQVYYGKSLKEVTLPEMAMLAGLPKAPSRDNPLTNPEAARLRRNYVLRQMYAMGYIDQATLDEATSSPLTASRHAFKYDVEAPYVAEMVRQHMLESYDEKTYAGGFDVYTTIDSTKQRAATEALRRGILEYDRRHGYRGPAGHVSLRGEPDQGRLDDILKDYRAAGDLIPGVVLKVEDKSAIVYTQDGYVATLGWAGIAWARPYVDENTRGAGPKTAGDVLKGGDVIYLEFAPNSSPEKSAADGAPTGDEPPGFWRLAQVPQVSGALVSLRPSDGAILALTGGFDFYQSSFNRVTQAERQPGSSLKPFIYTAALDKGFTAASTVSGAPIVIEDAALEDEWRPENYSRKFFGPTRLRRALALSLNLVSIRLLRAIGPGYAVEYLQRFGFDPGKLPRNLTLALGTASVTPLQMASAYAVFANGGHRIEPYLIARVEDSAHQVLERANPLVVCKGCDASPDTTAQGPLPVTQDTGMRRAGPEVHVAPQAAEQDRPERLRDKSSGNGPEPPRHAPRVLNEDTAFIMETMLQDVIRQGTGRAAMDLGRQDLAGKTGTTNEYRDAWFSGFNSDVIATAWIGFDQPASLGRGETGSRAALPIWMDFMRAALDGVPDKALTRPPGIVTALINRETGRQTDENDPDAMVEYFEKGTAPGGVVAADGEPRTASPPATIPENIREKLF